MSTIKVDTIQSRQHSSSTINLTSTGATVNGDCTATTFSGSGASLTSIPAANLTGTLPAIDGSNLTNVGGGSLEFVSKTTVGSSSVASIDFTGLSYDSVYKLYAKKIILTSADEPVIKVFLDGSSTALAQDYSYMNIRNGSTSTGASSASSFRILRGAGHAYVDSEFEMDFHTGYRGWIRSQGHFLPEFDSGKYAISMGYLGYDSTWSNYSSTRISGIRLTSLYGESSSSYNFTTNTEVILYKYKET